MVEMRDSTKNNRHELVISKTYIYCPLVWGVKKNTKTSNI